MDLRKRKKRKKEKKTTEKKGKKRKKKEKRKQTWKTYLFWSITLKKEKENRIKLTTKQYHHCTHYRLVNSVQFKLKTTTTAFVHFGKINYIN